MNPRHYEAVIIYDVAVEPQAIQASLDGSLEVIRKFEGEPGALDRWGRRPFAYEVKHKREGYYVIVSFTGTPATVAELDRTLGLADEVLRHKIIRLPDHVAARAGAKA
jgi:small subunit ribosomal protein S6